ncbi:metallophosphoesterase family protein [Eionea flava]
MSDTLHLGHIDKPLLIFGGSYSNLQATEALKTLADQRGITGEQCICTGDIVAYCGQPAETVDLIRKWGVHCVLGNCEESLASDADDCGCGFDSGSQCDLLSNQWFHFSKNQLPAHHKRWFSTLPKTLSFSMNGIDAIVVHGSISSINQFIFYSTDKATYNHEMSFLDERVRLVIGGHSGLPFSKKIGERLWHNSGALGMPANDGTTSTWYSLIHPNSTGIEISHHRLPYNHIETQRIMQDNGLNNEYAHTLSNGLWPSIDVLTEEEKSLTGKKLEEHSITIKRSR